MNENSHQQQYSQHSRASYNNSNIRTRLMTSHVQHEMLNSPVHFHGYYTPERQFQESRENCELREITPEIINNNIFLNQVIVEANGKTSKKGKKAKNKHAKNVSEL